jgi:hypothetical protein
MCLPHDETAAPHRLAPDFPTAGKDFPTLHLTAARL